MLKVTQLSGFGSQIRGVTGISKTVPANAGTYSLAGTAATLTKSKTLTAGAGSYAVTGVAAGLAKGGGISAEAAAFLARTSGLDSTHTSAYTALINGLVADGVWSKLDVLHIYATQNTTTAQLNLVSSSYPATLNGSPTFTTDRGYTGGTTGGSSVYINTSFTPSTVPSPKYTQNSAHLSGWSLTIGGIAGDFIGVNNLSTICPRYDTGIHYSSVNSTFGGITIAIGNGTGHFVCNRSDGSNLQAYRNGASLATNTSVASLSVPTRNMYALGNNNAGTAFAWGGQQAMISIGSSLSSTDATNFYNRLRTYMTAMGVP